MKRSPRRASPCARHPSTDVSFGQEKGPRPPLAGAPFASVADGGFLMIMERVSPAVAVAARHVVAMAELWEDSQGGFPKTGDRKSTRLNHRHSCLALYPFSS